ncbi:MAG: hypothetical protein A2Y25_10755 [Candidatus Melainabacteria bacterium GWF2_37_15]|nr:MAG: hypothetical protein A2Y25_10755 [Candidatus Melainabacteria bacterium GWF2_37_15]
MSYKNDHLLTISNKYGEASSDAKAMVFETYDRLRDLTVSGPGIGGASAYGNIGNFFINLSKLIGPSNYMPVLGSSAINIPGTSYSSPISGGYSSIPGVQSAFGMSSLGKYPGFPTGGAASLYSIMALGSSLVPLASTFSIGGMPTGGASALTASIPGGNSYVPAVGAFTGLTSAGAGIGDITLPVAGVVGGIGGLMTHMAPYFGPSGLVAALAGNLLSGYSGAAVSGYNYITSRIITNADTILTMKIKNLETTVKQLDTQGEVIKKMLKSAIEADSKVANDL